MSFNLHVNILGLKYMMKWKPAGEHNSFQKVICALCFIAEVDVKHAHKTLKDTQSKQRNVENDGNSFVWRSFFLPSFLCFFFPFFFK